MFDVLQSLVSEISTLAKSGGLEAYEPEPPRFFLTCMAGHLTNTIVGYDVRDGVRFCATPDFALNYLSCLVKKDTMILVKREERECVKLTQLDQGKFLPEAIASYPDFDRSYPALCAGQDDKPAL